MFGKLLCPAKVAKQYNFLNEMKSEKHLASRIPFSAMPTVPGEEALLLDLNLLKLLERLLL
ncbi:hypothetical protein HOV93_23640 [Planctomycetes bacterium FF15]|uniref:Uncharacterized protein n=1 Tax=Bremerella alba TaxID=980252 RepID=A0A7V9A7B8_9BACT|nr:hypothetical protein [Bremerella alba]